MMTLPQAGRVGAEGSLNRLLFEESPHSTERGAG